MKQEYAALNIIQYYGDEPVVELLGGAINRVASVEGKRIAIQ